MAKDRIFSSAMLLLATVLFIETFRFPEKTSWMQFSGADFPRIVLVIMFVLSLTLLILSFVRKNKASDETPPESKETSGNGKVLLIFVSMGLYLYVMPIIGFVAASIGFLFICQGILMGLKQKKLIVQNVIVSVVIPVAVYYIFNNLLRVLLP